MSASPRWFRQRRGGVPPALRDLLFIALIVIVIDAVAALLLLTVYLPARRREAFARTPAQLALLARDRQNALAGWVRERLSDAEMTASLLADGADATNFLDRFLRVYAYETALLVDERGAIRLRRGSAETDDATIVRFAREALGAPDGMIDFRRVANGKPKVLSAHRFVGPGGAKSAVVYVSDPYDYVYPLFETFTIASRTGETNLIGLVGDTGIALNPYPRGGPPPMVLTRPIPRSYVAQVLRSGERAVRWVDRLGHPVIGVVKAIPHTSWVVAVKIDEEEVLDAADAETLRLGELLAVVSLMLASIAFASLRSRRMHELRIAEERLARLFENSTTGILILQVIFDERGAPIDHEVVDMNPAAEELLGVTAAEEIGKRSAAAPYLQWPPEIRERHYAVALTGTSIRYERFEAPLARWLETRAFAPQYGQFAQLFTDITERKKSEAAVRNLSARLLREQDDARRRMARDLHETVAQSLAGIHMNLGVIKRCIAGEGRAADVVEDSLAITNDAITEVRTMAYLLHPPMIDQAGLLTALRWYVEGFEKRSGIATTLDAPDDLGRLSRDVETSVFRIVQECLTNIQRHSGSATAHVALRRDDHHLRIDVEDQGRGLASAVRDDRDKLLATGVGIAGINERVHELHGELTIRSSEGGTALSVSLPLATAEPEGAPPSAEAPSSRTAS